MINIDLDVSGIERTVQDLRATEAQVKKALTSALAKLSRWLRVQSLRGLSKQLQVSQKVLRRRLKTFRLKRSADGAEITVWYGLDPIGLIYLGARQTRRGVTAGQHRRDGAFIARGKRRVQVFKRRGASRLPLNVERLSVSDSANIYIEDNLLGTAEMDRQFFKLFEHELRWQTR